MLNVTEVGFQACLISLVEIVGCVWKVLINWCDDRSFSKLERIAINLKKPNNIVY